MFVIKISTFHETDSTIQTYFTARGVAWAQTKYLKAVVERDRSGAAHHVGYVRDESNGREELNSFKCARCGRPCPPKIARRAKMQIAFHKLSQDL